MRRGLGCLLLLFIALKCSFKIRDIWSLRSSWSKRNRSDQLYRFELTSFEDDWKAPNQLLSFSVSFLTAPPPPLIWTWYLYVWVCVCVWERGCVRVRERVCEGVWEGVCVCVWEREREREKEKEKEKENICCGEREMLRTKTGNNQRICNLQLLQKMNEMKDFSFESATYLRWLIKYLIHFHLDPAIVAFTGSPILLDPYQRPAFRSQRRSLLTATGSSRVQDKGFAYLIQFVQNL